MVAFRFMRWGVGALDSRRVGPWACVQILARPRRAKGSRRHVWRPPPTRRKAAYLRRASVAHVGFRHTLRIRSQRCLGKRPAHDDERPHSEARPWRGERRGESTVGTSPHAGEDGWRSWMAVEQRWMSAGRKSGELPTSLPMLPLVLWLLHCTLQCVTLTYLCTFAMRAISSGRPGMLTSTHEGFEVS